MPRTRVTVLSYGTRGDVQPLLALSVALAGSGYRVTLAAERAYEPEIRALGIDYAPVRFNLREWLASSEGVAAARAERGPSDSFETMAWPMLDDHWAAAQNADALIYDTMLTPASHMADRLGIPAVMTSVMPNMSPTREFRLIGGRRVGWGGWANRLSYQAYRLLWLMASTDVRRWCQSTLGFTPPRFHNYWKRRGSLIPIAYSFSRHVLPEPADWPDDTRAVGYWFFDGSSTMKRPLALDDFLRDGPPPVFIGFGSMSWMPDGMTEMLIDAVRRSGQRAILQPTSRALRQSALPDSILLVNQLPYDWTIGRVRAVVHHGGSGATAAALRFGVRSVVCPSVTDQFLWAEVIERKGWGVRVGPRDMTVDTLVRAIRHVGRHDIMLGRVAEISQLIRRENSLPRAIEFLSRQFRSARTPRPRPSLPCCHSTT